MIETPTTTVSAEKKKPFLGNAVKNGRVRFLSVSQIVKFDPASDEGCPRSWAFQYVFGKKSEATKAQTAGTDFAKEQEVYLKTGADVLSPVMRAVKHLLPKPGLDLEVEEPLGDIERALKLRDEILKVAWLTDDALEITRAAGLTAAGVPIVGAADFRHARGEYVDSDGVLKREQTGLVVVEVGDLKSTSRINDHKSRTGKVYAGYAKTVEQVLAHPQMIGYGRHAVNKYPGLTHVRLGHIYAQTKNGYAGAKRTGLLSVEEVLRRWERVETVAREMQSYARALNPIDVPTNTRACRAYNRDCPHIQYCDRPPATISDLLQIKRTKGETPMGNGLFDLLKQGANGVAPPLPPPPPTPSATPPTPPLGAAEYRAETDAEKTRLLGVDGYVPGQPCNGHGYYASSNGQGFIVVERGHSCAACVVPQVPRIGAVNPLDRPLPDPIAAAAPLSPEAIAAISDPTLKAKAEAHAKEHAERAREDAPEKAKKTGGRCVESGKTVMLTDKEKAVRSKTCVGCAKEIKIRDKDFTPDFGSLVVPQHNRPKEEAPAVPPIPPQIPLELPSPPPPSVPSPPPLPSALTPPTPPPMIFEVAVPPPLPPPLPLAAPLASPTPSATAAVASGVVLYVDVVFDKGETPKALDNWYLDIVRTIETKYGLDDIRLAPNTSDIGYGRWKGLLAAMVRSNPLAPGEYSVHGSWNEIVSEVVAALAPLCSRVVRGAAVR